MAGAPRITMSLMAWATLAVIGVGVVDDLARQPALVEQDDAFGVSTGSVQRFARFFSISAERRAIPDHIAAAIGHSILTDSAKRQTLVAR